MSEKTGPLIHFQVTLELADIQQISVQKSSCSQHLIALVTSWKILRIEYQQTFFLWHPHDPTVNATAWQYSNETTTSVTQFSVTKHYKVNKLLISDIVVTSYHNCSSFCRFTRTQSRRPGDVFSVSCNRRHSSRCVPFFGSKGQRVGLGLTYFCIVYNKVNGSWPGSRCRRRRPHRRREC